MKKPFMKCTSAQPTKKAIAQFDRQMKEWEAASKREPVVVATKTKRKPKPTPPEPMRMYKGRMRTEKQIAELDVLYAEAVAEYQDWLNNRKPIWVKVR